MDIGQTHTDENINVGCVDYNQKEVYVCTVGVNIKFP